MDAILTCALTDLVTESDVEQKFVLPLLKGAEPIGLGYHDCQFRTKPDIRQLTIDKGKSAKYYFPDYVIVESGLPLLIVEAKKPGEDINEAYREARLYASEVNAQFPHKVNPTKRIIATDGYTLIAGFYDSVEPFVSLEFADVSMVSEKYHQFLGFCGKKAVLSEIRGDLSKLRGARKFSRPLSLIGNKTIQNYEIKPNSFGETISLTFRNLFNPQTNEERKKIVENAYVPVKRHLRHIDPIDKIIRATKPISTESAIEIADSTHPSELISKFSEKDKLKNQLLLLIGSVGSGKSTFTDYLKNVALEEDLKKSSEWITINLNIAPVNKQEIYTWIKERLASALIESHPEIDFEEGETLKKVYGPELLSLRKKMSIYYAEDSDQYKSEAMKRLLELDSNIDSKSKSIVRYLCWQTQKLLIVVLDNCDKRKLDDQLLMFDVANWLKEEYSCLVFLPLRDTTFDNHRTQPPLDTVIKDLVFRIEPPLLRDVILQRVKYALRLMPKDKNEYSFSLSDGIRVDYPSSDQGKFLANILRVLFGNVYFSRLITGLAGRDIRRGLEIFLDFCKSGHVSDVNIFKYKQFEEAQNVENHVIIRVLLRGNRKYYSEAASIIKNLFHSFPADEVPNPFTRLAILNWLKENYQRTGPSKITGYHKISLLFQELISLGFSYDTLKREFEFLLSNKMVISESQNEQYFDEEELAAIAPSGIIHLELLNDYSYFAATSEDVWYNNVQTADTVSKRISGKIGPGIYSKQSSIENANDLIEYLKKYMDSEFLHRPEIFLESGSIKNYFDLSQSSAIIKRTIKRFVDEGLLVNPEELEFKPGDRVDNCEIVNIIAAGVIVEFGLRSVGFVHRYYFLGYESFLEGLDNGDLLACEVIEYRIEHGKYNLKFVPRS